MLSLCFRDVEGALPYQDTIKGITGALSLCFRDVVGAVPYQDTIKGIANMLSLCGVSTLLTGRVLEGLAAARVTKVACGNLTFQQPNGLFFILVRAASLPDR